MSCHVLVAFYVAALVLTALFCAFVCAFQSTLVGMLSAQTAPRPNAAAFASCQWFQEDMLLRALRFLDGILQRESSQKVRTGLVATYSMLRVGLLGY
jgi:hypothetical protein